MLYLEDYLEMIEHLPQELRDRFTEMRSLDLSVQNNMDALEKQVKHVFGACRRGEISGERAEAEFTEIRKGYAKSLEDADEKVQVASQMHELVERYLRKLDTELYKFKCELEADNKGITEVLEKRSLELDAPTTLTPVPQTPTTPSGYHKDSRYRVRAEKRRESLTSAGNMVTGNSSLSNRTGESSSNSLNSTSGGSRSGEGRTLMAATPPLSFSRTDSAIQAAFGRAVESGSPGGYSIGHMGAGNALAAAASQAIAATQQMQQGRRSASLKASYEAINAAGVGTSGLGSGELQLGRELAGAAQQALQAVQQHDSLGLSSSYSQSSSKRHKKKSNYSNSSNSSRVMLHSQQSLASVSRSSSPTQSVGSVGVSTAAPITSMPLEDALTDGEWAYDPNEPRYCICNQVSYGEMVACDNQECPFEWFHYPCVGVTAPPKGKWYCPPCTSNMRRRGNRKN